MFQSSLINSVTMLTTKLLAVKKRKITSFFSNCTKNSNQEGQHPSSIRKSSKASEISILTTSSLLTPSGIPDLVEFSSNSIESSQTNVVQSLDKQKTRECLMKHCPRLITEDVMRNEAFIECLSCSVDNITSYEKQKEIYQDKAKRRKPTTELLKKKKKMKSVDEKLNDLFARMERASQIGISLDLGTHNLSIAAAQKNVSLTLIANHSLHNWLISSKRKHSLMKR